MKTRDVLMKVPWQRVEDWSELKVTGSNLHGEKAATNEDIERFVEEKYEEVAHKMGRSLDAELRVALDDWNVEFHKLKKHLYSDRTSIRVSSINFILLTSMFRIPILK